MGLEIFNFRWSFGSEKMFFTIKLLIKLNQQKNQENFIHRFGDYYFTNHLVKFQQDRIKPWRVGVLRVCTGYHFLLKNIVSEGFQPPLTFRVAHINNSH